MPDKPAHLTQHVHWLGWCVARGGHCLLNMNEQCAAAETGLHQDGITRTDKSSLYPTWHL